MTVGRDSRLLMQLLLMMVLRALVILVTLPVLPSFASTYIPVEDEVYTIMARLEAEGIIRSGLLSTKPISRSEGLRLLHEAETNVEGKGAFVKSLVRSLKERLGSADDGLASLSKPVESAYVKYAYINQARQDLNYNNNGDKYSGENNLRSGFTLGVEDACAFSFYLNPEYRHPDVAEQESNNLIARKAYGVYGFGWDLIVGKDSQWWGPGYHGALLLTNNAEPFTMVKISNPTPVTLPWILKKLGPFGFSFFVTNLEKARDIPEPYLYGLRFDFKPHPNIEIGLEKTALLGGHGRSDDWKVWRDSLLPFSDKDNRPGANEPGDQRAGIDIKWSIPSSLQPVQLYLEAAGEDEYHNLPNLWAFVGGVYFPRVAGVERLDFRLEFATTRGRKNTPYIWYVHHIYTSGYTYKGNIIGHHMGTDANDSFMEVSWLMPEQKARIFMFFDRKEHNLYVPGYHEINKELGFGVKSDITQQASGSFQYIQGWILNPGNADLPTIKEKQLEAALTYMF